MNSELTREWREWHNRSVYETGRPPDVGSFVGRENHRLGGLDSSFACLLTVVVEGDVAALAEASAVVGEFHPDLVLACGDGPVGLGGELGHAEQVLDEFGGAVQLR